MLHNSLYFFANYAAWIKPLRSVSMPLPRPMNLLNPGGAVASCHTSWPALQSLGSLAWCSFQWSYLCLVVTWIKDSQSDPVQYIGIHLAFANKQVLPSQMHFECRAEVHRLPLAQTCRITAADGQCPWPLSFVLGASSGCDGALRYACAVPLIFLTTGFLGDSNGGTAWCTSK